MDSNCNICDIVKNPQNLITQTKNWLVMLSPDQGYLGRSYLTLKTHKEKLSDLTVPEWNEYIELVQKIENTYTKALNAKLFNWTCLMNNAYQKKPYNPHIHWHLRPRYNQEQQIDTIVFADPDFGRHYNRNHHNYVDENTLKIISDKITNSL